MWPQRVPGRSRTRPAVSCLLTRPVRTPPGSSDPTRSSTQTSRADANMPGRRKTQVAEGEPDRRQDDAGPGATAGVRAARGPLPRVPEWKLPAREPQAPACPVSPPTREPAGNATVPHPRHSRSWEGLGSESSVRPEGLCPRGKGPPSWAPGPPAARRLQSRCHLRPPVAQCHLHQSRQPALRLQLPGRTRTARSSRLRNTPRFLGHAALSC